MQSMMVHNVIKFINTVTWLQRQSMAETTCRVLIVICVNIDILDSYKMIYFWFFGRKRCVSRLIVWR